MHVTEFKTVSRSETVACYIALSVTSFAPVYGLYFVFYLFP